MEHEQNSFKDLVCFFWHLGIIDVLPQAKILRLHAMDLQMRDCKPFALFRKCHKKNLERKSTLD